MTPLVVYGSKISYFTGKLEGYLRYKGRAPFVHGLPVFGG